jgi:hypothetical protein
VINEWPEFKKFMRCWMKKPEQFAPVFILMPYN